MRAEHDSAENALTGLRAVMGPGGSSIQERSAAEAPAVGKCMCRARGKDFAVSTAIKSVRRLIGRRIKGSVLLLSSTESQVRRIIGKRASGVTAPDGIAVRGPA